RHIGPHDLKHLEHAAVGQPRRHRQPAAGTVDPGNLGGGGFGPADNITPNVEEMASNSPSPNGSFSASPILYSIARFSAAARARASASKSSAMSAPGTFAPRRASSLDVQPVPVARSSTFSSALGSSRTTQCSSAEEI